MISERELRQKDQSAVCLSENSESSRKCHAPWADRGWPNQ
jgi:hypothetical protein